MNEWHAVALTVAGAVALAVLVVRGVLKLPPEDGWPW
jgi:hypothetical protein